MRSAIATQPRHRAYHSHDSSYLALRRRREVCVLDGLLLKHVGQGGLQSERATARADG
jgi:hypothetical protein